MTLELTRSAKFELSDGSAEALKWLALVLMTLDHINRLLFDMKLPYLTEAGRLAMPIFGFVLAYNFARPHALEKGMHKRAMKRLLIFGLLATPFYGLLHKWLPLNILFTLMLVTGIIYMVEKNGKDSRLYAVILFTAGGLFVEYAWFGLMYCLAAWRFCKSANLINGASWIGTTAILWICNLNYWACAALAVIFLAARFETKTPRLRYMFYAYYPAHLALLLAIKELMPAFL